MTFTIYTLGDLQIFWSVLNAVAMVFQSSMFDPTQGAGAFVLGGLISLVFIIVPPMMGKKMDLIPMFFVFLIFFAGIVPKARVQIEDVYTGNVTAVDNVPLIVAFPGAVAGIVSKAITDKVETAFSTASGSYLSMGAEGFANPLKLLLTFRGSNNVPSPYPYLSQSTMDFVRYCAIPASNFDIKALNASTNVYGTYFPNLAVSGITTYYNAANPNGYGMSCELAKSQLAADAILATTPAILNPIVKAQLENGVQSTTGAGPTALGITNAFDMAVAGTGIGQSAQQFMMNAIAKEPIEKGVTCATASISNLTACQQAVLIKVAQEKQAVDAAASATIFTKTIIPAMNILLALFYAFSPILLAVALMSAGHGVKIIMGFLLFGVWTQSWMPIAAVINYMIELQTNYEVSRFALVGGITPGNIWQFYDTVRTKIGLASELLAMTPMISFGLLSGSMMALTGISQKFGARDYVSEENVAPDVLKVDPVSTVKPYSDLAVRHNFTSVGGGAGTGALSDNRSGFADHENIQSGDTAAASLSHAKQNLHAASESLSKVKSSSKSGSHGVGYSASDHLAVGHTMQAQNSEAYQKAVAVTNEAMAGIDASSETKQAFTSKVAAGFGMDIGIAKLSTGLESSLGITHAQAEKMSANLKKANSSKNSATRQFTESSNSDEGRRLAKQVDQAYQKQDAVRLDSAEQRVESAQESYASAENYAQNVGAGAQESTSLIGAKAVTGSNNQVDPKLELAAEADLSQIAQDAGMSKKEYNNAVNEKMRALAAHGLDHADGARVAAGLDVLSKRGSTGLAAVGAFMSKYSGDQVPQQALHMSKKQESDFNTIDGKGESAASAAQRGTASTEHNTKPADHIPGVEQPKGGFGHTHQERMHFAKMEVISGKTNGPSSPDMPSLNENDLKTAEDVYGKSKQNVKDSTSITGFEQSLPTAEKK